MKIAVSCPSRHLFQIPFNQVLSSSLRVLFLFVLTLSLTLLQTIHGFAAPSQSVIAWGKNYNGELGDGTTTDSIVPLDITNKGALNGKTITQIVTGYDHSLALCSDGTVASWGDNQYGQLGIGNTKDRSLPQNITNRGALYGKSVVQLVAGGSHSLAQCSDGTLVAWGDNQYGQLGDGTTLLKSLPVAITNNGALNGKTITQLVAGSRHNLALCSDGSVVAWGDNSFGQQGDGSNNNHLLPVDITSQGALNGKSVTQLVAGGYHSLAQCSDGSLVAWGYNAKGQLGDGGTTDRNLPFAITNQGALSGKTISQISAGVYHNLLLCSDGSLLCWGLNDYGQLGDGTNVSKNAPVLLPKGGALSNKTVSRIVAAGFFSIAMCTDGTIATWGHNAYHQLGDGTVTNRNLPVNITAQGALKGAFVNQFTATASHTLALALSYPAPIVVTGAATNVTTTSADLSATVNPNGAPSTAKFEYGLTSTYGSQSSVALSPNSGTSSQNVGVTLTNLAPHTTYHYRVSADNTKTSVGDDATFTTLNTVPYIVNSSLRATKDSTVTITPANLSAIDKDADLLTFTLTETPAYGKVERNGIALTQGATFTLADIASRALTYTNTDTNLLADSFEFSVTDGLSLVPGTMSITLTNSNNQTVATWGNNYKGELGDGTSMHKNTPFDIGGSGPLSGKTVVQIAGGSDHTLALCSDGSVFAWGDNSYGELGDGTTTDRSLPVAITNNGALNGKSVVKLVAGRFHSLALCSDGTIAGWGFNANGQLGDGTTIRRLLPVTTTGGALTGKTVIQLATGSDHSVALCSDGTVTSWGYNFDGHLGAGVAGGGSSVPIDISNNGTLKGKTVTQIAVGAAHTLALCSDGTLVVWGYNGYGQLGEGTNTRSPLPITISGGALIGKTIVQVAAGGHHSAVLCSDGTLVAWGSNQYGELGDGTNTQSAIPVAMTNRGALTDKTVTQLVAGFNHTLALCSDGTVASWGYNAYGQLGFGNNTSQPLPVNITAQGAFKDNKVIGLSTGFNHSLALVTLAPLPKAITGLATNVTPTSATLNGVVNSRGDTSTAKFEYGLTTSYGSQQTITLSPNNSPVDQSVSALVSGLIPHKAYHYRVSATNSSGTVVGQDFVFNTTNTLPQITGSSLTMTRYTTATLTPANLGGFDADGDQLRFVLKTLPTQGTLKRNGVLLATNIGITTSEIADGAITYTHLNSDTDSFSFDLSDGYSTVPGTVAITLGDPSSQAFLAWGSNSDGQLGTGNYTNSPLPLDVTGKGVLKGKTITQLYPGYYHSLALCSDGTLAAWGSGSNGRLGNGSISTQLLPVAVNSSGVLNGKTISQVAVGGHFNLALCSDGTLVSWGSNIFGQLGDGTNTDRSLPIDITGKGALSGKTVIKIAAGQYHSFALCSDGTLAAWGYNLYGQLGDGNTGSSAPNPLPLNITNQGALSGKTVTQITAGFGHDLALCSDGSVVTWGLNDTGQLGNGGFTQSALPIAITNNGVLSGKSVTQIVAGLYHSLALCSDGTVASWGRNIYGQLGNGNKSSKVLPVAITSMGVLKGKRVVQLDAGEFHSVALCSDGTLAAWGSNGSTSTGNTGQVGDGSGVSQVLPLDISGKGDLLGKTVTQLAAGGSHTLALATASQALTVVTGSATNITATTATLGATINPDNVATTATFEYGLTSNYGKEANIVLSPNNGGTAQNVTANITGLLPRTTYHYRAKAISNFASRAGEDATFTTSNSLPQIVNNNLTITGNGTTLITTANLGATDSDGDTLTFTIDSLPNKGILRLRGVGMAVGNSFTPSDIASGALTYNYVRSSVVSADNFNFSVSDGYDTVPGTLNITFSNPSTNDVVAWGYNYYGQLGDGTNTNKPLPTAIAGQGALKGKTVTRLAVGRYHTLALCSDGSVLSWGSNGSGQLGDGTYLHKNLPIDITGKGALEGKTVTQIVAGGDYSLALCSDGSVLSWGSNDSGQLGDGTYAGKNLPTDITSKGALTGKTVVQIAAGWTHNLAVCSDGSLVAWGANNSGKIGDGTTNYRPFPVNITGQGALNGKTVVQVAAGANHSLALCNDGTLAVWGDNAYGQLGNGTTTAQLLPIAVTNQGALSGKRVIQILGGASHTLALCSDGTVAGWGSSPYGQVGDGSYAYSKTLPVNITNKGALNGKTVTQLIIGDSYSLALCSDGTLTAWGRDQYNQLGDGTSSDTALPINITGKGALSGTTVTQIVAGYAHTVALATFVPAPSVVTGSATNITSTGATLGATINPNGDTTAAVFEYGLTNAYGSQQVIALLPDNGITPQTVSVAIAGLAPHTTYHYRAKASSIGTTVGSDATFTTLNTLPQIANNGLSVLQNTTATLTKDNLTATDADGDTLTFTLVKAPIQGTLKLNGVGLSNGGTFTAADINDGKVAYTHSSTSVGNDSFDFQVSDGIAAVQGNFAITLQYGPTAITLSKNNVPEKQAVGAVVGDFASTDADAGEIFTYSLVAGKGDTDNASFSIDGATLKTAATFYTAIKSSYSIRVQSTDSTGLTFQQQFTITVTPFTDSTIPVVTVSSPTLNQKLMIAQFTGNIVTGTASDNLLVSAVKLRLSRKRGTTNYYWNGTDFVTASTYLNATVNASSNATWTLNNLPPASKLDVGLYQVEAYATDNSGNKSVSVVRPFNLLTESIAPTLTVSTPSANQKILLSDLNGSTVSGTASDNVGVTAVKVRFSRKRNNVNQYWNGGEFTSISATVDAALTGSTEATWTLGDQTPSVEKLDSGLYQVEVYATDAAGNKSATVLRPFTLGTDFVAPSVSISTPSLNQKVDINAFVAGTIQGVAEDNLGVTSVKVKLQRKRDTTITYWNGSEFTATSATVEATVTNPGDQSVSWSLDNAIPAAKLDAGAYVIYATATDAAGNVTTSASRTFTVSGTASGSAAVSAIKSSAAGS